MFLCENCVDYPLFMPISIGPCEGCGKIAACADAPAKFLKTQDTSYTHMKNQGT